VMKVSLLGLKAEMSRIFLFDNECRRWWRMYTYCSSIFHALTCPWMLTRQVTRRLQTHGQVNLHSTRHTSAVTQAERTLLPHVATYDRTKLELATTSSSSSHPAMCSCHQLPTRPTN
jgi:hypothetical protein